MNILEAIVPNCSECGCDAFNTLRIVVALFEIFCFKFQKEHPELAAEVEKFLQSIDELPDRLDEMDQEMEEEFQRVMRRRKTREEFLEKMGLTLCDSFDEFAEKCPGIFRA